MIPGTDGMWKQVQAPKVLTENPWNFSKIYLHQLFLIAQKKIVFMLLC